MNESQANISPTTKADRELIFIIDDEPMLLELATVILEPLGHRIRTFRDPKSAFQAFVAAKPPPALVITDYSMHQMNGMELLVACRRLYPEQKVLMISGTVDETIFKSAAVQPDRFLAKPYDSRQLVAAVKELLGDD